MTLSQQRQRANAAVDGRGGRLAAYTGGARSVNYEDDTAAAMNRAWQRQESVQTYTSTPSGRLSANGRNTRGAYTNTFTPKNDDGTPVINQKTGEARQTGRSQKANRRQRDYDVRAGLNNITPKAMEAMIRTGQVRVVEGGMVGEGGNVIRQKANGNYTMGLSVG